MYKSNLFLKYQALHEDALLQRQWYNFFCEASLA